MAVKKSKRYYFSFIYGEELNLINVEITQFVPFGDMVCKYFSTGGKKCGKTLKLKNKGRKWFKIFKNEQN